jgi:hypothetical protein
MVIETSNSYYNATGLTPDTSYVIKIFTKDSSGNINTTNVNNTATTRDVIPPLAVTNLNNQSSGPTWIYWNWTNPTAPDFYQTIIYIDGTNVANLTAPINYYNATGLSSLTNYTIIINTMDTDINVNTTNVNNTAITKAAPDLTPPMAVTNLANKSSGTDWIYWNWTNPADVDFFEAIIYINGTNIANTSNNYYNATGLNPSSSYIIKVLTMDNSGNINTTNVNSTAVTQAPDLTPPLAITNLRNQSSGQDWIYWNWTNPTAPDFSVAIIYINGTNVANTSNNYYNATGLSFGSSYIIRVNTKDTSGNVNLTNVTNVSRTQPYVLPDALMVFASSTTSEINYSKYNSGAWGAISTTSYTPNSMIGYVVVKEAPTRDEYIVVTSDANNDVYARIFSNGNWHDQQVISLNANGLYRGFDVAYERTSGDALVVANNGSSNFTYYIWNGVSWSGPNNYSTTATGAEPYWIQLAEDPFSDEIAMMSLHSNSRVFAAIWNGNAFGNNQTLTTTAGSATTESIALAYEQLSGEAMFTWNNAATTTTINYRQWTGAAWGTASSFTITAAGGGTRWAKLAENSSSNALMYGQTDSASDLNTRQWSGTAWDAAHTEHSASVDSITSRCFDIAYETYIANGNALIIFAPNNNDAISISEYRGATTWTALTAYDPYAESTDKQVIRIVSGNGITEYMDADDGLDMNHWYFTESSEAWTSAGTSLGEISFDVYANREWFDAAFKR